MTPDDRSPHSVVAVIFDWAGTVVDHGSLAPVAAIRQLFKERGVSLTDEQIRKDMGLHKRDHIRRILSDPAVHELWAEACAAPPNETDAQMLFEKMVEVQQAVLREHSCLLPHVTDVVNELRERGIKIGSTTGYVRDMMAPLLESARQQGYAPDCVVCADDVGGGRPFPWMMYSACVQLRVYPLWRCVKVGDTVSDVQEGLNAGAWTVGVWRTGNLVGMSAAEWSAQSRETQASLAQSATRTLEDAGAHFVVESIAELPAVIEQIDRQQAASPNFRP